MTTKFRYFVYLLSLHVLIGGLAWLLLKEQLAWLLLIEVLLLISLALGFRFYQTFMLPTKLIDQGEAALKDGDFTAKFISSESPEVERLISLYNQMIDNLRLERTSKEERQFFLEKLMASTELGIVLLDYDGKIDSINNWAKKQLHLKSEVHKKPLSVLNQALNIDLDALPIDQAKVINLNGSQRFRLEKGRFIDQGFTRVFLIFQDITRDLLTAEKEAYGKVIRMMAHEVNNSTGATNSMLNSLLDTDEMEDTDFRQLVKEYLPLVTNRGERMNDFMRNFANVIRLPQPHLEQIDLTQLLHKIGLLFEANLQASNITISYPDVNASPLFVAADPSQLEQVIINAITNSKESLDGQAGQIKLETTQIPRGFIIADNGPGIPESIKEHLFTPFFSTKATGQGIGLTLSRDILEGHNTQYYLRTDNDGWTRFGIAF